MKINNNIQQTISYEILKEKESIIKYTNSNEIFNIPEFIKQNLKHDLRDYQKEGFENYILLNNPLNNNNISNILKQFKSKNNHHLFHMATGSGKTMMMAATIVYLYSLGYKRFIFTTNQTNLISKTKLNLLPNLKSSKCEFKNKFIEIEGKKNQIKEVENFSKYSNDIEIIFTTIQNLHNKITEQKENSINLHDIETTDIVILADEAHHFQTKTKLTKTKKEEENNWEDTIQKILNINPKNKLIEYTATMDLSNKDILDKYKSKIIYDYTLKSFREDGYSKEISLIQNNNKEERILQSILINQYRYVIGHDNDIPVVPKIFFKSTGMIEDLKKEQEYVLNLISNLNIDMLNKLLKNSKLSYIIKLSKYLDTNQKKENYISLIKNQFNNSSSLIVHSKDKNKEEKFKIANNLDKNDKIRMIFAIDMLNEGWDVLSLFDIVKIDEIEKKTISKSTTSEVQLIGRGARIFPYLYKNELNEELDAFKRKFDNNISNDLRLLEDMNFYSANDNDYINKLKTELIAKGLKEQEEKEKRVIKVKPNNELSDFAKFLINKFVYTNKLEKKHDNSNLISDYDINIQITKDYSVKEENIIGSSNSENNSYENSFSIKDFIDKYENIFILNYSINFISYYSINNISSKYKINNKEKLIKDIINLGNKISITIKNKNALDLSFNEKITIMKDILIELSRQLEFKRNIKIGTKSFKNKFRISDTFTEYSKNENNVKGFNEELNYKTTAGNFKNGEFKIINSKLFYYDSISWDSGLELELYNLFDKNLNSNDYLVIRNEVGFKMFNPFTNKNFENDLAYISEKENIFKLNGEGFEPDFIVLKKIDDKIIQYFIEVKGEDKIDNKKNEWKEHLLLELENQDNTFIEDNTKYKIYGLPFFTEDSIKNDSYKKDYINKLK